MPRLSDLMAPQPSDKRVRLADLINSRIEDQNQSFGNDLGTAIPYAADQMYNNPVINAAIGMVPGVGDIQAAYEAQKEARSGNYGSAALNAVGVLPFIPAIGGMIKSPLGRIPENGSETTSLADMLARAGDRAGYHVTHEGSAISPSRYVTFHKPGDDAAEFTRQVRISNHLDKYPELASGIRTSVDPSSGVTFEQATNWLAREGFPTSLSSRYKDVPTYEKYIESRTFSGGTDQQKLQKLIDAWRNQPKATRGPMPTIGDIK